MEIKPSNKISHQIFPKMMRFLVAIMLIQTTLSDEIFVITIFPSSGHPPNHPIERHHKESATCPRNPLLK